MCAPLRWQVARYAQLDFVACAILERRRRGVARLLSDINVLTPHRYFRFRLHERIQTLEKHVSDGGTVA